MNTEYATYICIVMKSCGKMSIKTSKGRNMQVYCWEIYFEIDEYNILFVFPGPPLWSSGQSV
jgi:hypothetical protein